MRKHLLIFLLLRQPTAISQVIPLKLPTTYNEKKETLPFRFSNILVQESINDTLAVFAGRKINKPLVLMLPSRHTQIFADALNEHFTFAEQGPQFLLCLHTIQLTRSAGNIANTKDSFLFRCEIRGINEFAGSVFCQFYAHAVWGNPQRPEIAFSENVLHSLLAAVEKFHLSYRENNGWSQILQPAGNGPNINIQLRVSRNEPKDADSIACESGYRVRWCDFREQPAEKGKQLKKEEAKYIINYKLRSEEKKDTLWLFIRVNSFLHKANSWRPTDTTDAKWLQHQQAHFDLCAAYGLKLFEEIKQYSFSAGEYRTELNRLYNKLLTEYEEVRRTFDLETNNGKDERQNLRWQKTIQEMLFLHKP